MNMQTSISQRFAILTDNRAENHIRHNLTDILTIVLCGVSAVRKVLTTLNFLQSANRISLNRFLIYQMESLPTTQ